MIAITKAALAEAGVSLEALEDAATRSGSAASSGPSVDRSETVILVKNLPYSASEGELMVSHVWLTSGTVSPQQWVAVAPEKEIVAVCASEQSKMMLAVNYIQQLIEGGDLHVIRVTSSSTYT